jgi:hypothetical protein
VLNFNTAKALGVEVPLSLLALADRVSVGLLAGPLKDRAR